MTSEGFAAADSTTLDDETRQFCYRHPQRETWVRCGRCDRPICTSCSMQGPVGLRCKQCGKPAFDPLTSFTPAQLLLGTGAAVLGGLIVGLISAQIGVFGLILAFFAGGFIAETVRRVAGYKHGPIMLAITIGGIFAGTIAGHAIDFLALDLVWLSELEAEGIPMSSYIGQLLIWGLIDGVVASAGAWYRLR